MKKRSICLLILVACLWCPHWSWAATNSANSIIIIAPYKYSGTWVFDDRDRGLTKEPFVAGIPDMMDNLTTNIPKADKGFRLLFSAAPFPGYQTRLTWRRAESKGNWYYSAQYKCEGWLCASLFKYFTKAPRDIYIKAEAIKSNNRADSLTTNAGASVANSRAAQ